MKNAATRRRRLLVGATFALLVSLLSPAAFPGSGPQPCYYGNDDVAHPCADLTVAILEPPEFDNDTTTLTVTLLVTNNGALASTATTVEGVATGWDTQAADVGELAQGGGSAEATLSFEVPDERRGQTDHFVVTVDPKDAVEEPPTENNTDSVDIKVPVADLVVSMERRRFTDEGTRLELTVRVKNAGDAPSTATTVQAVAGDGREADDAVPALRAGASKTFVLAFDVPEERFGQRDRFIVTVDPSGDDVVETKKENNTRSIKVPVPTPDLALARSTYEFSDDGKDLELSVAVRNLGKARSSPTRVEGASPGWETKTTDVGGLAPGASEPVRLVFPIQDELRGRSHRFSLAVDPDSEVPDPDRANNGRTTSILIGALPASSGTEPGFPVGIAVAIALGLLALGAAGLTLARMRRGRLGPRAPSEPRSPRAEPPMVEPEQRLPVPQSQPPAQPSQWQQQQQEQEWQQDQWQRLDAPVEQDMSGPAPPVPSAPAEPPPPERVVSTGFALRSPTRQPVDPDRTLVCGERYYFWLEVGAPVAESIEETPSELPVEQLPSDALLTVALFAIDGSVELEVSADTGELRLEPGGGVVVVRQPGDDPGPFAEPALGLRRLFFPLRTPDEERVVRFRCNIYHDQLLVQSRLIRAQVARTWQTVEGALTSTLDYTLAPRLEPALLGELPEHRLSLLVNRNGDGTHGLAFYGEKNFKSSASFDGEELQDLIQQARGALRRAAWGDEEPWQEGKVYLYDAPAEGQFETDLIRFAIRGFRFYAAIIDRLAGGPDKADALGQLMERPGLVQIATKESPRHLLPASMIYDYVGFDTTARFSDYRLCPSFLDALEREAPLDGHPCFRGDCPSRGEEVVVCPSGFWGFRHRLGMPVSVAKAPDAPSTIVSKENPALLVAVSTDPVFSLRAAHEQTLQSLRAGLIWSYAASRADAIRLMKQCEAEVVYFYCHGGVQENVPYIQVGPLEERGITADYILSQRIRWKAPRPLVFINGCHTTALEPERALEFVSVLVRRAQAAGVIGTEITVFEPLARLFAEECLRRFLAGEQIGEAIRAARLTLLQARNPLGLAYLGFVLAGLRIVRRQAAAAPARAARAVGVES